MDQDEKPIWYHNKKKNLSHIDIYIIKIKKFRLQNKISFKNILNYFKKMRISLLEIFYFKMTTKSGPADGMSFDLT
ncbi:hypothetical protein BpHYR1_006054 [Brachionus plicatilis]|uniref:Uncharacterized protein n=1 Tax=Brachionus plicatilis TaxID=10195 RepID=A0A3M7QHE5_BRAPC|nr:hypothetical protein BpHYR1_006054 [Brachionus plicatilis]